MVDPTGASDTFAGGFIGHVWPGWAADALKQGIVVGGALASFTCEAFGTEGIRTVSPDTLEAHWSVPTHDGLERRWGRG